MSKRNRDKRKRRQMSDKEPEVMGQFTIQQSKAGVDRQKFEGEIDIPRMLAQLEVAKTRLVARLLQMEAQEQMKNQANQVQVASPAQIPPNLRM